MPFIKFQNRNILFVHIPKTGGSSVEAWLEQHGKLNLFSAGMKPPALNCTPQHLRYWDLRQLFDPGFFDYAFTIIRNPFHRLESEYRMRVILQAEQLVSKYPPFPIWLGAQLDAFERNAFHLDNHLRPLWHFTSDRTEVFRFEDGLDQIIAKVAAKTGIPHPAVTPREMTSEKFAGLIEWDQADILRVQTIYQKDFETFGYPLTPTA
ncbi:MAG: hypothetical protein B7X55_11860 [Rhodobacterales bacterium 34-62-10]|nr:MAG: hypothetical protein B7X55_11860 [Rhodobacterales bacterium 34-62-10]